MREVKGIASGILVLTLRHQCLCGNLVIAFSHETVFVCTQSSFQSALWEAFTILNLD